MTLTPTQIVGMLIPDASNEFFLSLAQHFQRQLAVDRCATVVVDSDGSSRREAQHLRLLLEMDVRGIVYIAVGDDLPMVDQLQASNRPILVLDREVPVDTADFVILDNRVGVRHAVEHLVALGHRRIAHIEGLQSTEPGRERKRNFLEACEGVAVDVEPLTLSGDFTYLAGRKAADEIAAMPEDRRPTAVLAGNDLAAIGGTQRFQQLGWSVPDDISIVGFDDISTASWVFPPLTTVRQDVQKIAEVGARLLRERMSDLEIGTVRHAGRLCSIDPQLVVRESTGPALG